MRAKTTSTSIESGTRATIRLCRFDELVSGVARRFDVGEHRIAVVRIEDHVYAIGDRCTHQDVSLSEGEVSVEDAEIECFRHGSTFLLKSGEALSLPATKPTPVYRVEIIEDDVYVDVGHEQTRKPHLAEARMPAPAPTSS